MRLYELAFGLYPRRVSIYLAEKGIAAVKRVSIDLIDWPPANIKEMNPAGTVPILETDNGVYIRNSIAILEYLEECFPTPTMLGDTPGARARTREMVAIIDEATTLFCVWARKVSPLFAPIESQSAVAGRLASITYNQRLKTLDTFMEERHDEFIAGDKPTVVDCIAYSQLQFARDLYGVQLPAEAPRLVEWFQRFSKRPSAAAEAFPAGLIAATMGLEDQTAQGLPAKSQPSGV
jgi:glutathione S-transferase